MWLMTQHGFYSIVQKAAGVYHVRSRERADLENLVKGVPLPDAEIHESREADYAFRLLVGKPELDKIMAFLGNTVDYPNFKGRIDAMPAQAHKPYHKVWRVLADTLGAYGRPGSAGRQSR
jgi:hypothetical protein